MQQNMKNSEPQLTIQDQVTVKDTGNDEKYPQHIEAIPGNAEEVWYNIPELGIRIKLNKEFAEDLVYEPSESYAAISFQKKSVLLAAPECKVSDADFGYLYRFDGTIEDADKESDRGKDFYSSLRNYNMVAEFSDFFVALSTDRADACWWGKTENKVAEEAARKKYAGLGAQSIQDAFKSKSIEKLQ